MLSVKCAGKIALNGSFVTLSKTITKLSLSKICQPKAGLEAGASLGSNV
jgi:hypothetical protein